MSKYGSWDVKMVCIMADYEEKDVGSPEKP
jgi:hypothetical protein